ncbi:hypothetical protein B2D07_07140 [Desulfococcus multivorans]|uniref:Penicillin-binding protein transpeptidase n=2 Tax=Desulfococcus multivorans TaxID=897 RepID=S7TDU7_DESML|nr:hypothetical protein B2D07_07140 [Desulfococcus multivorans]EPR34856.1 penicillin-binding protein transpeptidase [Desulfococcus multivorans DSM 2059]SJZ96669.1 Penicillin binding protein transpeptidase domain-containing protein [Desulfococcus multivorans DSM 2059]
MIKSRRGSGSFGKRPDWRTYQSGLKRERERKRNGLKVYRYAAAMALLLGFTYFFNGMFPGGARVREDVSIPDSIATTALPEAGKTLDPSPAPVSESAEPSAEGATSNSEMPPPASDFGVTTPLPETGIESGNETAVAVNRNGVDTPEADSLLAPKFVRQVIDKAQIQLIFDRRSFVNLSKNAFDYDFDGRKYQVDTSINTTLQRYMLGQLQRRYAHSIGIVIMEPETGRILSMISHDREDPDNNVCTESLFPAASIFKIITAAAAVEECGLQPDSTVTYSGAKHTLYRSQLNRKNQRHLNHISLRDSFAQSVNPVFGKLGLQYLGKKGLISHAEAFGFNQEIDFELPTAPSPFSVSDEPYNWAEIASGFNRSTLLSPLHGAVIASTMIANQGCLVEPSIVDQITDSSGRVIYKSRPKTLNRALSPKTTLAMRSLMKETVLTGTCRKTFQDISQSPILSRLNIGGKSGSINSRTNEGRRFDWFVGYAEEKEGDRKIVISIVVAHQNFIGTKANMYARMAIEKFFEDVGSRI